MYFMRLKGSKVFFMDEMESIDINKYKDFRQSFKYRGRLSESAEPADRTSAEQRKMPSI